jgi:large subunit ribosomal protein L1
MMRVVGPLGKQLGPRMPSKKAGNITDDIAGGAVASPSRAVEVEFKMDRGAVLHVPLGLTSFSASSSLRRTSRHADRCCVREARPASHGRPLHQKHHMSRPRWGRA